MNCIYPGMVVYEYFDGLPLRHDKEGMIENTQLG